MLSRTRPGTRCGVGAVRRHREAECERAQRADGERGEQRAAQSEARRDRPGERRAGHDDGGRQQERDAGLEGVVAVDVLEVERQEVEHRAERRREQERDRDAGGEVAVGEQPQRHERVGAAPLDEREGGERDEAPGCGGHDRERAPAEIRALHEREHEQRDAGARGQRAGQIERCGRRSRSAVGRDERRTRAGSPAPASGTLTKKTASQPSAWVSTPPSSTPMTRPAAPAPPQTATARLRSRPSANVVLIERQRGREDERPAEALHRARDEQELGLGGEPAGDRGAGVQREAGDEDPPAAEQVGGAAAEQQEAGGGHGVGADHRLQGLRRVAQLAADLGQCHDDDVLVERDDQHRERQQRERRRAAVSPSRRDGRILRWTPRPELQCSRRLITIRYGT